VHDTYADVIADPDVDLVYNALVNSLHAQCNIAALQAGKHVLSEKPLTSNAAGSRGKHGRPNLLGPDRRRLPLPAPSGERPGCASWSPPEPWVTSAGWTSC
jgi:hypothetical protein